MLDKHLKSITAIVKQQISNLHKRFNSELQATQSNLEATHQKLKMQMAVAEAWLRTCKEFHNQFEAGHSRQ